MTVIFLLNSPYQEKFQIKVTDSLLNTEVSGKYMVTSCKVMVISDIHKPKLNSVMILSKKKKPLLVV